MVLSFAVASWSGERRRGQPWPPSSTAALLVHAHLVTVREAEPADRRRRRPDPDVRHEDLRELPAPFGRSSPLESHGHLCSRAPFAQFSPPASSFSAGTRSPPSSPATPTPPDPPPQRDVHNQGERKSSHIPATYVLHPVSTTGAIMMAIITPGYYPRTCGLGDHSALLAHALSLRGQQVVILTRAPAHPHPQAPQVQAVGFTGRTPLATALAMLRWFASSAVREVLVQYTPLTFDASRFGSPAIPLLIHTLRARGVHVTVMAHELFLPWSIRPDTFVASALHRLQFAAVALLSNHLMVTTETRVLAAAPWTRLARYSPSLLRISPNVTPVPWTPPHSPFRIGCFSTLAGSKRFDVLLDAFALVARALPASELWLLGDMLSRRDRMTRSFQRAVTRHPARDRIHVPGKQPLPVVAAQIATLHVFLFPMDSGANTRSGTLPLALGTGVPVVATRGVETDSLFQDHVNILFAQRLAGGPFAEAVLTLQRNPDLARRIGAGGRRLHDEHLSWPRITDALLSSRSSRSSRRSRWP